MIKLGGEKKEGIKDEYQIFPLGNLGTWMDGNAFH